MFVMFLLMDWQSLVAVAGFLTALVSVAASMVFYWKSGGVSVTRQVIDTYKDRVEQMDNSLNEWKKRTEVCERKHDERMKEVSHMQGVVQTLERVLENRDPKLQDALEGILSFMQRIEQHMVAGNTKVV